MSDLMVWIDLETTGLTDNKPGGLYAGGEILELGLVVTDARLNLLGQESWRWPMPPRLVRNKYGAAEENPGYPGLEVLAMHQRSGLLDELRELTRADLPEYWPVNWLTKTFGHGVVGGPMCGSSVHFDREWLRHRMPELESLFSHRNVDVSGIREAAARWWPELHEKAGGPDGELHPRKMHRALADIGDTLDEGRWWMTHLGALS